MSKDCIDTKKIRSYFPIFNQRSIKSPTGALIYFDNASTAQVPSVVIDAMTQYYTSYKANVGRGIYDIAEQATAAYEQARSTVAQFIGAQAENIVFTSGATQGINLIAQSWASYQLVAGDEIMISAVEHHSNFLPWQELARKNNVNVRIIPVSHDGVVDAQQLQTMISPKTKLIAIVHTSNVLGSTNNVADIVAIARQHNIAVLVDASQSVAHQKIDVAQIGCDFLVFSGHKLFGPTGVGVLYVAPDRARQMHVGSVGGGMVFSVDMQGSQYRPFPYKFEAGTPNISGVIGMSASVRFMQDHVNFDDLARHENSLASAMVTELEKIHGVKIVSSKPRQGMSHIHMVTFVSDRYHAHDIAAYLNQFDIAVRAGHHCVQPYHDSCGLAATVRLSFSVYNTHEEVAFCIEKLRELLS